MRARVFGFAIATCTLMVAALWVVQKLPARSDAPPPQTAHTAASNAPFVGPVLELPPEPPTPKRSTIEHTIRSGESFGGLLTQYGVTQPNAVIRAAEEHYDVTRIQAGKTLLFEQLGSALQALSYRIDEDRTLVVQLGDEEPTATVEQIDWTVELDRREITLKSSLWNAALDAGFRPRDIVTLAKIFEYDLDFSTELKSGARLTVVMDALHHPDGKTTKSGQFHAVRLDNNGETYTAIRYVHSEGQLGYYHPDGKATARPFLRSPLEFTRITSNFGVKRKTHYHGGVDMGARTGTPVRAAGDGRVTLAGWNGGYGKQVKLNHSNYGPYKTSYAHLSKILVRKGARVKQGDIIGLVGNTGRSTGPHLHYEFHIRGKRVNPMKIKLPGSKSLERSELPAFFEERDRWLPVLEHGLATPSLSDADEEPLPYPHGH